MRPCVEMIAKALVDQPEAVEVSEYQDGDETVLELRVAQDDLGKVIGKQGRTVRAMRILLDVAGAKQGRRYDVEILD